MKAFIAAVIALAVITLGADQFLRHAGFSSADVFSRETVRLSE